MVVYRTKQFTKLLEGLPLSVQLLFEQQEKIFKNNWLDARLHVKKLKELEGVYSFRITRRYRALFYFESGRAVFFAIGHRKDIYQ